MEKLANMNNFEEELEEALEEPVVAPKPEVNYVAIGQEAVRAHQREQAQRLLNDGKSPEEIAQERAYQSLQTNLQGSLIQDQAFLEKVSSTAKQAAREAAQQVAAEQEGHKVAVELGYKRLNSAIPVLQGYLTDLVEDGTADERKQARELLKQADAGTITLASFIKKAHKLKTSESAEAPANFVADGLPGTGGKAAASAPTKFSSRGEYLQYVAKNPSESAKYQQMEQEGKALF